MNDMTKSPLAGDNLNAVDYGAEEAARLREEYGWIDDEIARIRAEFIDAKAALPGGEISEDSQMEPFARLEKAGRDLAKRIEGFHGAEKLPHLRRGQAVDKHFFGAMERLVRPKKTGPNGLADDINDVIGAHMERKRKAEEARRLEAERAAREAERKAREERQRVENERREAEAKAARARNEENRKKAQEEAARLAREEAARREEEIRAQAATDAATRAAEAKPADMVGTRIGSDIKITMKREYSVRCDVPNMPASVAADLWPFLTDKAKEAAANAWAKATNYQRTMEGVSISYKDVPVTK